MSETGNAKVAIVTGAGSGVGQATAVLLAAAGYHTVLVARTESKLEQTAKLIRQEAGDAVEAVVHPADLSDASAARGVARFTLDRFGRVDAVANVAGSAPLQPIDQVTDELWRTTVDTNLSYVVQMTAELWPKLKQQGSGVIVNVSSMASVDPFVGFSIYAAVKSGVNLFTKCTADEGAKIGVKAVAVAPGAIETPMLRANFSEKMLPAEKTLDPYEVAEVIRDCITGRRQFENGETIMLASP